MTVPTLRGRTKAKNSIRLATVGRVNGRGYWPHSRFSGKNKKSIYNGKTRWFMLIIDFARVFETCIFLRVFAPGSHQGANPKNKKHGYLHFVRSFSEISIRVATLIGFLATSILRTARGPLKQHPPDHVFVHHQKSQALAPVFIISKP